MVPSCPCPGMQVNLLLNFVATKLNMSTETTLGLSQVRGLEPKWLDCNSTESRKRGSHF